MDNYQINNENHNELPKEVIELFGKQWIRFNDEQKNDILQGNAQLRVNCFYPKAVKKKDISSRKPIDKTRQDENLDYTQLSQRLDELNSREEGIDFLKSSFSTKKSLESFAKFLKISTQKQNLQELRESIVSATIGYRLTIQFIEKRRRPKLEDEFLDKNEKIPDNNIEENDNLSINQQADKHEIELFATQMESQLEKIEENSVVEFYISIVLELYFLVHIELLLVQLFHYSHLLDQI
ncbi:MAG: hypothetical protein EA343_11820 [Nodularia sp. (in: Bacteria)]|nr:MAG: hypothetical protein EA343_11820 [Nodularia sp. (in: cyanobacteria)]